MSYTKRCTLFFGRQKIPSFMSGILTANRVTLNQIYHHPFNQQLFNGTLPQETFGRYLRDDYYYLHQFSSILQTLAQKTIKTHPNLANHLDYLGKDIINNELRMQEQYKEHLQDIAGITPGRAVSSYAAYLSKTAEDAELPVALSAVLPCFWIYYQLGVIHKNPALNNNPYEQWIAAYLFPDFIAATKQLVKTTTQVANQSPPELQLKMKESFGVAAQFELDFFDEVFPDEVCTQECSTKLSL